MLPIVSYARAGSKLQLLGRSCVRRATTASATPPAPPLLLKLRRDLKTAMQEKDKNRLNVLRGLISDITTATKSNNPVTTDMHVLAMLRKRAAAGKEAAEGFAKAGRRDLEQNEEAQVSVLEEYAGGVETVSDEEIRTRIGEVINEASQEGGQKLNKGILLRKLLGPGGAFEGKPVEKSNVAKLVDAALGTV